MSPTPQRNAGSRWRRGIAQVLVGALFLPIAFAWHQAGGESTLIGFLLISVPGSVFLAGLVQVSVMLLQAATDRPARRIAPKHSVDRTGTAAPPAPSRPGVYGSDRVPWRRWAIGLAATGVGSFTYAVSGILIASALGGPGWLVFMLVGAFLLGALYFAADELADDAPHVLIPIAFATAITTAYVADVHWGLG